MAGETSLYEADEFTLAAAAHRHADGGHGDELARRVCRISSEPKKGIRRECWCCPRTVLELYLIEMDFKE